jgi:multimeric flavodoxin WrbA
VLKDDLAPVLANMEEANVLVMGTPLTGEDPTAYFKIFFDRFYSFLKQDGTCRLPAGKKVVIMFSHGAAEAEFLKTVEAFEGWLEPFRFSEIHWILYQHGEKENTYEEIEAVVKKLVAGADKVNDWS